MLSQRKLAILAFILLAGGLAYLGLRTDPIAVEVMRASRGDFRVSVDEEGETRVKEKFIVAAPVTGRLRRVTLDPGDNVLPGDIVAEIVPQPLDPRFLAEAKARKDAAEAQKLEADARVEQVAAALAQARRSARRARQLAKDNTISSQELEVATLDETTRQKELEAARAGARTAGFHLEAAEAALLASDPTMTADSTLAIRSPVQGTVLRVYEESERVVPAGTPVLEVGNPKDLEIVIDVLSTQAVQIFSGAQVEIEDWGGDGILRGWVRRVEPSGFTKISALGVEEQRVNVIADFDGSTGGLGDAYRVEAKIITWSAKEVLRVPSGALFRAGDHWAVFVANEGKAHLRQIRIGYRGPSFVQVTEGLIEGERVILHPSDLVGDGAKVHYAD